MKKTPHLKAAKPEIAAFFAAHADDEERTAYIEHIFNDDYTELLIGSDERRVGYKTYQNVLHLWEGSYLSRTSESFYDWGVIAAYYGTMLVMGEFLDDATPDGQLLLTAVPEKKAIPDAAIDAALQRNGSGFEGGKYRIYAYFSENHTAQERADFLKNEFGIGGICPALPGSRLDEWHDSKGIRFARRDSSGTQVEIRLSWSQMQSRIMGLITVDHYLTQREKADMPAYQQHAEQKRREASERDADWKSAHAASPTMHPFQKPDADFRTDAPVKPTPPPTVQMSLFPTAKQQQIEITQAEDMKSSAFSLAQDDINQVLCAGSLFQNGNSALWNNLHTIKVQR